MLRTETTPGLVELYRYGIVEFNVPRDTVQVILESPCTTFGQETERVNSYNSGAHTGQLSAGMNANSTAVRYRNYTTNI